MAICGRSGEPQVRGCSSAQRREAARLEHGGQRVGSVAPAHSTILPRQQWQIQGRIETKVGLELDIEEYRRTLRELEGQARGVRIVESASGTFLVLPPGAETGWTVGGRAAVKLPD